jgi:Cellulase (glycosyl hydrolase family 5)
LLLGVVALAAAMASLAQPAWATRGLETGFDDVDVYQSSDPAVRDLWFDRTVQSDAGIVRLTLSWRSVTGSSPPTTPSNPADPSYNFNNMDAAVQSATAHGVDVVLMIENAPAWAEGAHRPSESRAPPGTWDPRPGAFHDFAQAVATRYSGSFLGLPRVRFFQAWNEPNLSTHFTPQWRHGHPASPQLYRRLLNAFYAGVKSVQPRAVVLNGGTAPYGDPPGGKRMRPLTFLRKLFCLNPRLRPTKCGQKPHLDALDHHPIDTSGGPHRSAVNPNDASMPDYKHVKQILRAAERHHHIVPGGRHQLWASEFWWDSNPPDRRFGVRLPKHARWIEEALYLLWKQGARVAMMLQIRDAPFSADITSHQTGIFFVDGRSKPAFRAYRFPFVTHRVSKRRVAGWGKAPTGGPLKIERRAGGRWRTVKRISVASGHVFTARVRVRGRATLRAATAGDHSLAWHQGG